MATKKEGSLSRLIRSLTTDVPSGGVRYETVRSGEKKPFPFRLVIAALLITAMLMTIIFSFVQIARMRSEIGRLQSEIAGMEAEIAAKQRELDERYRDIAPDGPASDYGIADEKSTRYLPRTSEDEITLVLGGEKQTNGEAPLSGIKRLFRAVINFFN